MPSGSHIRVKELLPRALKRRKPDRLPQPAPLDPTEGIDSVDGNAQLPLSDGDPAQPFLSAHQDDDVVVTNLWREALASYKLLTGVVLENSDLYRQIRACSDERAIVSTLESTAGAFEMYRHPAPYGVGARMRSTLIPIVRAVLAMLEVAGEAAASSTLPGGKAVFVAIGILLKTIDGVSARFDAVAALLGKFKFYLARLNVRSGIPFGRSARSLAVEILVQMLRTLAIAARTMRRNRLEHFLAVLVGRDDDLKDVSKRADILVDEEARLTLAEAARAVHNLSSELSDALIRMEAELRAILSGVEDLSANLQASGAMEMPAKFEEFKVQSKWDMDRIFAELAENNVHVQVSTRSAQRINEVESRLASLEDRILPKDTILVARFPLPSFNSTSFPGMASRLLERFRSFSAEDQVALRRGIANLYAFAAVSVSGGNVGNPSEILLTSILEPSAVLSAFLPMAITFIAMSMLWRVCVSRSHREIPRGPGYARKDTLILIDVLGTHIVLPLNMTWADIHSLLLEQLSGKAGWKYVQSNAYKLVDTSGDSSFLEPHSWEKSVRSGMVLEMSVIIRQVTRTIYCPLCATAIVGFSGGAVVRCIGCRRQYRASHDDLSEADPSGDSCPSLPRDALDTVPPAPPKNAATSMEETQDMSVFRSITIIHSMKLRSSPTDVYSPESEFMLGYTGIIPQSVTTSTDSNRRRGVSESDDPAEYERQRLVKKEYAKTFRDNEKHHFEQLRRRLFPTDPNTRRAECLERAVVALDELEAYKIRMMQREAEIQKLRAALEQTPTAEAQGWESSTYSSGWR
ncbi:hypothetical protein PENSPDRAFT_654553 [Peniophora sp. CONT]|nr:hypothetical protein PENSPDRAFT_654553 [Peniophora sp. CONT]